MVMNTPPHNVNTHVADNDDIVNQLKLLEDSVNAFIGNQCDHNKELFNRYEKLVISSTAETTKLDEIIQRFDMKESEDKGSMSTSMNNDNGSRVLQIPNANRMAQDNDVHIEGSVPSPNTNEDISGNELQYDSLCTEQNPLSEVPNESQTLWTILSRKVQRRIMS